jgi:hypothetical protein
VVQGVLPDAVLSVHSLPSPKRTTLLPVTLKVWPSLATVTHSSLAVSVGSWSATAAVSAVPEPPPQAVSAAAAARVRQK